MDNYQLTQVPPKIRLALPWRHFFGCEDSAGTSLGGAISGYNGM
jgi:hypothetical protein